MHNLETGITSTPTRSHSAAMTWSGTASGSQPTTCIPALKAGLAEQGHELGDVRHLLLSHIHLDHAGAAGALVRDHPELQVWVSEVGAPHLVDPARLERSARRLYGESFDALWGELAPVPSGNVRVAGTRAAGLEAFPTTGHASHHISFFDGSTLYAGDAAGVRIQPGRTVLPPTPPPDVDVEAWYRTLDAIERRAPERLALVHFGVADDVSRHLAELRERLDEWARRVEDGMGEDEFVAAARGDLPDGERDDYDRAMPFWQSYHGLRRYWDTREERAS